jgi:hypothetical protein
MDNEIPRIKLELVLDDAALLLNVLQKALKAGILDDEIEGWVDDFNHPLKKWCIKTAADLGLYVNVGEE